MNHTGQMSEWPKIKRVLIVTGALLFGVLAMIYLPLAWKMRNAQQVFSSYNRALLHKHYGAAYDLLDAETAAAGDLQGFIAVQQIQKEHYGELLGYENTGMDTATDDEHTVDVHAVLIFDKGRVPFLYVLKKKHFFWVVNAVKDRGNDSSDQ
jgi:hypothetical protein